jgi:hypothetical protein
MDDLLESNLELEKQILAFNVPDEVLERAANAEGQGVTWAYCTNGWQSCEWPQ